jgi:hypothetical protein
MQLRRDGPAAEERRLACPHPRGRHNRLHRKLICDLADRPRDLADRSIASDAEFVRWSSAR